MADSQNVQIPLSLFRDVVSLLNTLSFGNYAIPKMLNLEGILSELNMKLNSINLRYAYTKVVRAKDDEERFLAKKNYLYMKKQI